MDGWQIKRCAGVEAALTDAALAPHTLVAALEALPTDTKPEPTEAEFVDAAAQGILLEALAPLVQQVRLAPREGCIPQGPSSLGFSTGLHSGTCGGLPAEAEPERPD